MNRQMTKKILSALLTVVMVLSALPIGGMAGLDIFATTASALSSGVFEYEVEDGKATITDCDNNVSGELTIPDSIDGCPVTGIGNGAFSKCFSLTAVNIPEGITSIGQGAFNECSGLTTLTIPEGVTSIGSDAFNECCGLISAVIPEGVTAIENNLFYCCHNLETVTLPSTVTSIEYNAFGACYKLKNITLPQGLTSIGDGAFGGCQSLEEVNLQSVISIGNKAFSACLSLEEITIPESTVKIGYTAFEKCKNVTRINIPSGLTSFNTGIFLGCDKLESVTVAADNPVLSSDGNGVVYNKDKTQLVYYPDGKTGTAFTVPDGVTSIGKSAFAQESNLTSITLPESIERIEQYAFSSCTNLTDIYYGGTQREWNNVVIRQNNDNLLNATKHFTAKPVYTVEFYDGDTLLGSKELEVGEESTLSYGGTPTREGSRFMGWKIIGGDGTVFEDGSAIIDLADTQGAAVKYRAVWEWIPTHINVKHEGTGVAINYPVSSYSGEVTVDASLIESGEAYDIACAIEESVGCKVYTLRTLVDGVETLPDGEVSVMLPIPRGFDMNKCKLFCIDSEENKAVSIAHFMTYTSEGLFYLSVDADHFDTWAVVQMEYRVTSLELISSPYYLQYVRGDSVSTQGMKVLATYSNGWVSDVTDEVTITNYSSEKAGNFTATVEFGGATTTFDYKIITKTHGLMKTITLILLELEILFAFVAGTPVMYIISELVHGFTELGELFKNIIP